MFRKFPLHHTFSWALGRLIVIPRHAQMEKLRFLCKVTGKGVKSSVGQISNPDDTGFVDCSHGYKEALRWVC